MLEDILIVALGLLLCPICGTRREFLEVKTSVVFGMTTVAAGVPGPFFQEDRLDFRLEDMKIKSTRWCGSRLRRRRRERRATDPGGEHLPFRVGLRLPKFTACFLCQSVEQQTAF